MSNVTPKPVKTLLSLLIAMAGVLGLSTAAAAGPGLADVTDVADVADVTVLAVQPPCGDTSSYDVVPLGGLPPEATDTAELIERGGPFPYPQDGTVFQNREAILPDCPSGYYHEYTVRTPGSPDRGARRIVTGGGVDGDGEHFYTDDHYASFVLVDLGGTPGCGEPTVPEAALSSLPAQVATTIDLVTAGGPYPYPEDGTVYENREGVLPACASGHYRLYTVPTPGVSDRGDRRLVAGADGAYFYTPDRYASFVQVDTAS